MIEKIVDALIIALKEEETTTAVIAGLSQIACKLIERETLSKLADVQDLKNENEQQSDYPKYLFR